MAAASAKRFLLPCVLLLVAVSLNGCLLSATANSLADDDNDDGLMLARSRYIESTNAVAEAAGLTYELGETEYTDLTNGEFMALYTVPPQTQLLAEEYEEYTALITTRAGSVDATGHAAAYTNFSAAPASVDWREEGAVTPQLVDCDKLDSGCKGGIHFRAMEWITSNGGIATEADYPYEAQEGTCDR
nr:senescence-specific cysteine protease SAG12-like [Setaria viridis]